MTTSDSAGQSVLTADWMEATREAAASLDRGVLADRTAVVALDVVEGKRRIDRAVLRFEGGRLTGIAAPLGSSQAGPDGDGAGIDVVVPITLGQLEAVAAGELSLAEAYIRGDVKPEGSTGALLLLVELAEAGALASLTGAAG